jgi:hypothetical protein
MGIEIGCLGGRIMELNNINLPANFQDIDNIPPEEYSVNCKVRRPTPCIEHKVAFPSNNKRLYPELKNMIICTCERCGWHVKI